MRPSHLALAVLVAAVWGVNFTVIEIGLDHFPPLLFSALRFLAAALPAVFLVGRPKVAWKWIVAVGLVLGVAKFGLLFVGMDAGMPAGLSSLVLQIQAVFTAVIAALALGERPTRVRLLGMLVALAGIAVAAVDEGASGPLGAFALVVAAAACWGASNVLTRKAAPADSLNFMVWVSTVPVLPLLALSLLVEGPSRDLAALRSLDWQGAGTVVYVAWITTVFGFGAWGFLLRHHPASTVAPFSLLVPVFGMSSAALFLGEPVTPLRWCAAALLVGGVALTTLTPRRVPPTPPAQPRTPAPTAPIPPAALTRPTPPAPLTPPTPSTVPDPAPRPAPAATTRRPAHRAR
ncbi:EamA family transporter [Streptomyces sp. XY006]|uniref:EamA family transporter n=1 Tax=Streptomyces sp. XY006 TaxID=2021410 RepID=UPI000B8C1E33|nr:EamA family transporter [Streptomyces sp. XY006]OXS36476.1 EamA family transporter [Streptomyces sp. XY006]